MKDKIYIVLGVSLVVAVFGLLMAWNDGYLDGTIADSILKIVFPAALAAFGLVVVGACWFKGLPVGWAMLVAFLSICVFLLLPLPDTVYMVAMLIEVGIIMVSLIIFVIQNGL